MEAEVIAAAQAALSLHSPHRKIASDWLVAFQTSQSAWQVCTGLLQMQGTPTEAQMYAAQTLRQKVRRQLPALADHDIAALQQQLVGCLAAAALEPLQVLSQLCVAMASLVVQCQSWPEPLGHLDAHLPQRAMLHFLRVLPEEAGDKFYVQTEQRVGMQQALPRVAAWGSSVVRWLWAGLQETQRAQEAAYFFQAFAAWVRLGCLSDLTSNPAAAELLKHTFQALHITSEGGRVLAAAAWTAAEDIIEYCPDLVLLLLHAKCSSFPAAATKAMQLGQLENFEIYCSVFSSLCCSNMPLWASNTEQGRQLRRGLLEFGSAPLIAMDNDRPVSAAALEAWAILADHVADSSECRGLQEEFTGFVSVALPILSAESELDYTSDSCRASCFVDALRESCRVIGPRMFVDCICQCMTAQRCSNEAALFAMLAASEPLAQLQSTDVATAEQLLLLLRSTAENCSATLTSLATKSISCLVEALMTRVHKEEAGTCSEDVLDFALKLATNRLQQADIRPSAALLARNAVAAASCLGLCVPSKFLRGLLSSLVSWQGGSSTGLLDADEEADSNLVEAIAKALLTNRDDKELPLMSALHAIVGPLPSAQQLMQHPQQQRRMANAAACYLARLKVLLQVAADTPGDTRLSSWAIGYLTHLWLDGSPVLALPSAEEVRALSASCCKLAIKVDRVLAMEVVTLCIPGVAPLLEMDGGHGFLGVLGEVVVAYLDQASLGDGSSQQLNAASTAKMARAVQASLYQLATSATLGQLCALRHGDQHPDAAEAMLDLVVRVARCNSPEMLESSQAFLRKGVEVTTACIPCQHKSLALSALACLAALIAVTWREASGELQQQWQGGVVAAIVRQGPQIMLGLLLALLGPSPQARVQKVTCLMGCMAALPGQPPQAATQWLQAALLALPPGCLGPGEGEAVLAQWGSAMEAGAKGAASAGVSSYARSSTGRRLKKLIRGFADRHMST